MIPVKRQHRDWLLLFEDPIDERLHVIFAQQTLTYIPGTYSFAVDLLAARLNYGGISRGTYHAKSQKGDWFSFPRQTHRLYFHPVFMPTVLVVVRRGKVGK